MVNPTSGNKKLKIDRLTGGVIGRFYALADPALEFFPTF
jgi:hypothetical protein